MDLVCVASFIDLGEARYDYAAPPYAEKEKYRYQNTAFSDSTMAFSNRGICGLLIIIGCSKANKYT